MPTTNLFAAILGTRKIKWDATWNLVAWLFDPTEGHGLGSGVTTRLCLKVFGEPATMCELQPEDNLGDAPDGKSRWADLSMCIPCRADARRVMVFDDIDVRSPGSMRKLKNLQSYGALAKQHHPLADVRVIALTNATAEASLAKVRAVAAKVLGPEGTVGGEGGGTHWHLLSLATVGDWVVAATADEPNPMRQRLADFVEWARGIEIGQAG